MPQYKEEHINKGIDWYIIALYFILVIIEWLNIYGAGYNYENQTRLFDPRIIREEFGIPEYIRPTVLLMLGYPEKGFLSAGRHRTTRKPLYETVMMKKYEESNGKLIKQARESLKNPIGHCGHHCYYCLASEMCGGCRSNYNCCSFATLLPDGVCPNTKCVTDKGLEGCYECNELENCQIGYYGRVNEYTAKATALFIKEYGERCYTDILKKACIRQC